MSKEDVSPPWIEKSRFGHFEINTMGNSIIVNCGANEIIEIDKLYGPLAALGVRIKLEYNEDVSDWVVEREELQGGQKWIEVARWDCQLGWPEEEK